MIGTTLGNRYRIDELIGEGGMALVYKAEDTLLQRPVALKILRSQFASDAEFVERFRREAQAAARLSHPNVVNVYDVGQDHGLNYIVMECVRGENLKELIRKEGPFTVGRTLVIARQICEALHHAHHNNIIHRDIKPHNILITPEGRVKVTDFGIARAVSASTLTQDGSVLGSVQYFSPEQAKGAPAGVASDLYSLGCVIYEMLTGTVPFKGESPIAIALKHLQDPPPSLGQARPGIPPAVESLVARALAKDPGLRFPSAQAMLREIQAIQGQGDLRGERETIDLPTQVLPTIKDEAPRDRRGLWMFLGIMALAVATTAGLFIWWLSTPPKPIRVPNLVGLPLATARSRAGKAGFGLRATWRNADQPHGTVLNQDPEAGIEVRERSIHVWVSQGPEEVEVPDLHGLSPEEARTKIEDLGLVYEEGEKERSELVDEGLVAYQSPAAGTRVARGSKVQVNVSLGNKFVLENLVGRPVSEAVDLLDQLELDYQEFRVASDQPEGTVVDQWPAPGDPRPAGTIVRLYVSNGEPPPVSQP
ncbi:MAG: Stk1 family PASTA domain-containing Ser/Thr kinase [Bacteroidota bacterium]